MDLTEFRLQNPAYADQSLWPDEKLATGIYNKYYKDRVSRKEFDKKLSFTQGTPSRIATAYEDKTTSANEMDWQAYARKVETDIASEVDTPLEEPWVNPIDAAVMPGAIGLHLGKGIAKTAAMVSASLLAEPAVGQGIDIADTAMTEAAVPDYLKLPANLAIGMVAGTLSETGILKLGSAVRNALKSTPPTPTNVAKVLQSIKVEDLGSEDAIRSAIQVPSKPLDMRTAVKEIAKRQEPKDIDVPDIKVKDSAKGEAGTHLHGAALGAGAGLDQDDDGNYTLDPKMTVLGVALGAIAGTAAQKMIVGTRMPGVKGGPKTEMKKLRSVAREMKKNGASADEIFEKTALFQGPDKRWRYEIDDSKAFIDISQEGIENGETVGDMVIHPELFRRYPQMAYMEVEEVPFPGSGTWGRFIPGPDPAVYPGSIEIDVTEAPEIIERTVLHELQHAIQHIEGHERGGSPEGILTHFTILDQNIEMAEKMIKSKHATPEEIKQYKKDIKQYKNKIKHLGIKNEADQVKLASADYKTEKVKYQTMTAELDDLKARNLSGTPEFKELRKQRTQVALSVLEKERQVKTATADFNNAAFNAYERIAGEQEANMTMHRQQLSAELRQQSMPEWVKDTVMMSKINSSEMATTGSIGALYNGVDWETFEDTGVIQVDPMKAFKGALVGMAAGAGVKVLPKAADKWTELTKQRVLDPITDIVKGSITNETLRYQFGLGRSAELADMLKDYRVKANIVLKKSIAIGKEINAIAPTTLQQKRLTQILEGGITNNVSLAKKAHKINAMFKDLKDSTRALNLSQYSRFDELTRKQRADLRNIIKDTSSSIAERDVAQQMLNNHYHVASASEYLPIFHPGVEGLTKVEKAAVRDEIKHLKRKSRFMNPEGSQPLEVQIAQLENVLKEGTKKKTKVNGVHLDQGYATMRQDMPAETSRMFNDIIGPAYRVAKGTATQGTDVLKMGILKQVESNPEWVLPSTVKGTPANYIKLQGREWGPLNGKRVRRDILSDLDEVVDMRSNAERNMDKIMGYWKYGKAILNPVTHTRNLASNIVLAHLGGVSPADTAIYAAAGKALKQGRTNTFFREAEDTGLFNSTFIESDISVLRDELDMLRDPSAIGSWIQKAASMPSVMYDQNERFFKTALFIKAREDGMSAKEATAHAEKYLFNYQDIPPLVKHYKRWASPFVTYAYKAMPTIAESAITKPWKIGGVLASMYGIEELAKSKLNVDEETVEQDKSVMLEKHGQILLPFTDTDNNRLYLNAGDFMPWSSVGRSWGQSDIPLSDFLPTNPIFTVGSALLANKENYTGKEIHNRILDSATKTATKYLEYAWRQVVPSFAPGGYGADKMVDAFKIAMGKELKDYTGQTVDPSSLVARALFGVKLTPGNKKLFDRYSAIQMKKIQREVAFERRSILKQLQLNQITKDEADEQLKQLRDLHTNLVD
jgi:hypothetical protein